MTKKSKQVIEQHWKDYYMCDICGKEYDLETNLHRCDICKKHFCKYNDGECGTEHHIYDQSYNVLCKKHDDLNKAEEYSEMLEELEKEIKQLHRQKKKELYNKTWS